MELVTWLESYSVGNEKLDGQHKRILAMINALGESILAGNERAALMKIFSDLAGYAKTHFKDEEKMMEEVGYPDLSGHRERHVDLNRRLADYYRTFYTEKKPQTDEVMDFLQHWLFDHILEEDMRYREHLA
jgi:hemerythrin-like metal-binding protein